MNELKFIIKFRHRNFSSLIPVGVQTCDFIEPTVFPYWRYRSLMDVSFPTEWRNGRKIIKPSEVASTIWNFEKHLIRTYHCESEHKTRHYLELLKRVTPVLNKFKTTLKIVDVIQQSNLTVSDFILIFQQAQMKFKDLKMSIMNVRMSNNFDRMKNQALVEYKELMQDLQCDEIEPNEGSIFVKYRVVRNRVSPQVLIELDFNKILLLLK